MFVASTAKIRKNTAEYDSVFSLRSSTSKYVPLIMPISVAAKA
jgi:hypothetical protein